ncbi:hypothetical protein NQ317_019153 [Molorchus minor]|uniref:Uncharacterized protein n=1 Tax=Molorchus minor TaxID=1323400 RepID=A0ABQ9JMW2_9CUCU|nr:hypothetical protein NQ317_019153 [Molorchus minor]
MIEKLPLPKPWSLSLKHTEYQVITDSRAKERTIFEALGDSARFKEMLHVAITTKKNLYFAFVQE